MCQLTYCNLHDPFLNSTMIYFLSTIGSEKHNDGCGFICEDNATWKTHLAAKNITNLGEVLFKNIKDESPIPFHIRQATFGIPVTKENAHPFQGNNYILMHNGTLVLRNGEVSKDKTKDSDSERFLKRLDEVTASKPGDSFESIFNTTMEEFAGKFAFIIRGKDTKTDYIIRGKTAELWISHLKIGKKSSGYVINTSKDTMLAAFKQFVNIAQIADGEFYTLTEPVLLKEETIFVAKKEDIKVLGATKENAKPVVESAVIPYVKREYPKAVSNADVGVKEIIKLSEKIHNYLKEHKLELVDLQIIFQIIAGISLLEVTKEDLVMFVDYLLPKISASKVARKRVSNILGDNIFPQEVYKLYELEFPWPLNETEKVITALQAYNKSKTEAVG